jgi:hypothetical protein
MRYVASVTKALCFDLKEVDNVFPGIGIKSSKEKDTPSDCGNPRGNPGDNGSQSGLDRGLGSLGSTWTQDFETKSASK